MQKIKIRNLRGRSNINCPTGERERSFSRVFKKSKIPAILEADNYKTIEHVSPYFRKCEIFFVVTRKQWYAVAELFPLSLDLNNTKRRHFCRFGWTKYKQILLDAQIESFKNIFVTALRFLFGIKPEKIKIACIFSPCRRTKTIEKVQVFCL